MKNAEEVIGRKENKGSGFMAKTLSKKDCSSSSQGARIYCPLLRIFLSMCLSF